MRADSITLLLIGGLVAFAGCEGGGDVSGTPPSEDGTYEGPPSTYQKPPSTTEPVTDYQRPNGGGLCESICSFYALAQCAAGGDGGGEGGRGNGGDQLISPTECRSSCAQAIDSYECKNELVALIDCLLDTAELTCELLERAEDGDVSEMDVDQLQACQAAVDAYSACADPEGPKPMCAPPNTCTGCADACAQCNCENPQEMALCRPLCN